MFYRNKNHFHKNSIPSGFKLLNDAGEDTEFARMTVKAIDVSNGSEDGQIEFSIITGGSEDAADALTAGAIALAEANDIAPGELPC